MKGAQLKYQASLSWPLFCRFCKRFRSTSLAFILFIPKTFTKMERESIRDVELVCYLSEANTTIFRHFFFNFFKVIVINRAVWTTRMKQVFNHDHHWMLCIALHSRYSRLPKTHLQYFRIVEIVAGNRDEMSNEQKKVVLS